MSEIRVKTQELYDKAAPFAQPICHTIWQWIEEADPEIQIEWKWSAPVFCKNGMICTVMPFKKHVNFAFFNGKHINDTYGLLITKEDNKGMAHIHLNSMEDLDEAAFKYYVQEAIKINASTKKPKRSVPKKGSIDLPNDFKDLLEKQSMAYQHYIDLAPYKKREYLEWITSAKRENTRISRMEKAILLLNKGKGLNDKYRE